MEWVLRFIILWILWVLVIWFKRQRLSTEVDGGIRWLTLTNGNHDGNGQFYIRHDVAGVLCDLPGVFLLSSQSIYSRNIKRRK